MISLHY